MAHVRAEIMKCNVEWSDPDTKNGKKLTAGPLRLLAQMNWGAGIVIS